MCGSSVEPNTRPTSIPKKAKGAPACEMNDIYRATCMYVLWESKSDSVSYNQTHKYEILRNERIEANTFSHSQLRNKVQTEHLTFQL